MKTQSASQSTFFYTRLLIGLLLCLIGVLLAMAGLSKSVAGTTGRKTVTKQPGTWTPTGGMTFGRLHFTATLLTNGKVLVAGGCTDLEIYCHNGIASAELYDPATGMWTATGSMTTRRARHTATLLPSGEVLVVGGEKDEVALPSAELYDPSAGTWRPTGNMSGPRSAHMAKLITSGPTSGMVLVAGGSSVCGGCTPILDTSEVYDPSTETWMPTDDMTLARYWDPPPPAAILPDGSVLVVGGVTCCPYHWFNKAESYDPIGQTWTPTSPKVTNANADPVLLPDGKVLVAGGVNNTHGTIVNVADAEIYDPALDAWTATASMSSDRSWHTITLLPNGQALVAGGSSGGGNVCHDLGTAELYDPNVAAWSLTGNMTASRTGHTATLLPNGQVLAAGGVDCEGNLLSSAELYTPATTSDSCLPPPAGLVSWWSGDKTADDVQGINPGVLKNGASFTKGMVGPGFRFDGVDDYVLVADSPSLIAPQITLEAWGQPARTGVFEAWVTKEPAVLSSQAGYGFRQRDDGHFWFVIGRDGYGFPAESTTTVELGNWYHLVGTYDGNEVKLYVNGVLEGSTPCTLAIDSTTPLRIGGKVNGVSYQEYFEGLIDEVTFYNRVLSDTEILAIYDAGSAGKCKPEIFVSSITPSYEIVRHGFLISASIVIQDENGIGIENASVQIKTILPSGSVLAFSVTTDATGEALASFAASDTGLYRFTVRKVSHPTREYDRSLNVETTDTLVIP